jgi:prephenate dehydrogenase
MHPRRLSILGVGLLGGSIGLAARSRLTGFHIVGYAHRPETLEAARSMEAIQQGYDQPGPAVRGADLIILCTPVGVLPKVLHEIAGELPHGAIVTDVGSTKRTIVDAARAVLPPHVRFVGSHPMAGSEKRGVQFARGDLFDGATCITTPTSETDPDALQTVEDFWRAIGMKPTRLSPEEHDRILADVSHLPHALAAALVAMQDDAAMPLCGKGFLDATRIAAGDGGLWKDILIDNGDNVRASIKRIMSELTRLDGFLAAADAQNLEKWLHEAALRRQLAGEMKKQ